MRIFALVLICICSTLSFADKITLVNGDTLTGKLVEMQRGTVKFDSSLLSSVTVNWSDIESFVFDGELRIRLADGSEFGGNGLIGDRDGLTLGSDSKFSWDEVVGLNMPIPGPVPTVWAGSLTSSLSLIDSNRDAQNFNLNFDLSRDRITDRLTAKAAYAFANQSLEGGGSETTVDSWYARGEYDVFVSEEFFWYGSLRLDRDRISLLDLRTAVGGGAGLTVWNRDGSVFRTTLGLSYLREKFSGGEENAVISAQIGTNLHHDVNSWLTVLHDLSYFPNPSDLGDYFLSSELIMRSALVTNMFAEIKFVFDYDSTPAPGAQNDNYRYTMGVGMRF